ncbi:MAG TPA: PAS domain S-box protein [Verrucomicrobiae bacterium]|nr:PAS domain S-box protein [Verrucomicrobiae bacterium]
MEIKARKRPPRRGNPQRARQQERPKLEEALLLQNQLLAARDYAEAVIEAVPPLLVLDEKLRVRTANQSFCKAFKISPRQTLNRLVYKLGNGQWNIPKLRTLLEEVLPRKKFFKEFEVTHEFESIGQRTMLLSGRQVDHLQRILLFIEDITERRRAQAAIQVSEIRYRRLFEAARDGILILDPTTRKITDANPFMSELLGYPRGELLGKDLWEIGLLKDEKANQSAFRELQKKHFIRYEDLPLQNKTGQRREVEFVSNLYDEGGRKVIQCNIRDITQRKQAEESLRKSEKRFYAIFSQATAGIAQTDMNGRFTLVNKCYSDIAGRTAKELLGLRMQDLVHPDDQARNTALLKKLRKEGGGFSIEKRCLRPNGDIVWVRSSVSCINHAPAGEQYFLAVTLDITENKRAERALLDAKDEIGRRALDLEEVVAERTSELRKTIGELEGFSYSVSHDMRAPLRAMQSFAQFLVDEYGSKLDEQGVDYLHRIMRSAVRLDRLIQDVLSYTKVLHSNLPLERVNLDRLVRDMVETFPNGQRIKPEIRIQGTLPQVMGNEALLAQCVSNLLSNGTKFVAPGTTPRLEVSAEKVEDASIRVWFKDNGIGIAPENHERIFRLFERIQPATEYEGTGIGLSIVRKASERMGAEIGFESELGKGARFWIQLQKA